MIICMPSAFLFGTCAHQPCIQTETSQARRAKLIALIGGIEYVCLPFTVNTGYQTRDIVNHANDRQLFKILKLSENIAKTIARKNDGLKEKSNKYKKNLEYMKKVLTYSPVSAAHAILNLGKRYKSGKGLLCMIDMNRAT